MVDFQPARLAGEHLSPPPRLAYCVCPTVVDGVTVRGNDRARGVAKRDRPLPRRSDDELAAGTRGAEPLRPRVNRVIGIQHS